MYFIAVIALLVVLPTACVLAEMLVFHNPAGLMPLVGKWFVFWPVGVRQFVAGVMQTAKPSLTAQRIFAIHDPAALGIVREVGFGNIAMGVIGLVSLALPGWTVPAAVAGGLYYGAAGLGHAFREERNSLEQTAMVTDLFIFVVLAVFVGWSAWAR